MARSGWPFTNGLGKPQLGAEVRLGSKADLRLIDVNVRLVPIADYGIASQHVGATLPVPSQPPVREVLEDFGCSRMRSLDDRFYSGSLVRRPTLV